MPRARLVLTLCLAEILGMANFATFPALLPTFLAEWGLTNTEAGWINGIYYAGYVAAVPVLVSLTDRVDPRRIYLASTALGGVSSLAFALFADGFWPALLLRTAAGIGLAGTYMPGLKALSDRIDGPRQSRALAFYTASFGVGASLSFLLAGEVAAWLDWRWAFAAAALASLAAIALIALALPSAAPQASAVPASRLLDFRPVLRNRGAMAYVGAYAAHCWELFAMRAWIVAFLVFSQGLAPGEGTGWSATAIATVAVLMGVPSSVLGNELCERLGRRRVIVAVMILSAAFAFGLGFAAALPFAVVVALSLVYGVLVTGDSASITAGAVAAAAPSHRGATMAVHSFAGFAGAFLGPLVVGIVLDLAGGNESRLAWGLAFVAMGLGSAVGPLFLMLRRRAVTPR